MLSSQIQDAAGELLEEVTDLTGLDPKMAAIAIAVLAAVAIYLFSKPIRFILKLAINTLAGFAVLWVLNKFGPDLGLSLSMTWQNAVVTGVFGLPGVAVLLALRWANFL